MSRFIGGVQATKVLEEAIEKEDTTRLNWHAKRGSLSSTTSNESNSRQKEVFRKKIEMDGIKVSDDFYNALPNRPPESFNIRIKKFDDEILENTVKQLGDNTINVPEMRPVTPCSKALLFDGLSKEGKGRAQYLRQRKGLGPEEKFEFPLVSSWEYGWRLGDIIKKEDIKKPPFGRVQKIRDTFYTRNGVPDLRKQERILF